MGQCGTKKSTLWVVILSYFWRDDKDTKSNVGKGDSSTTSSPTGASVPGTTKAENGNLNATVSSVIKNRHSRNLSTNVKPISKRLVPTKDYKLIQKVEEKVVQEKSVRTGSPRRRK